MKFLPSQAFFWGLGLFTTCLGHWAVGTILAYDTQQCHTCIRLLCHHRLALCASNSHLVCQSWRQEHTQTHTLQKSSVLLVEHCRTADISVWPQPQRTQCVSVCVYMKQTDENSSFKLTAAVTETSLRYKMVFCVCWIHPSQCESVNMFCCYYTCW